MSLIRPIAHHQGRIDKFGNKGKDREHKEVKQLNGRNVWKSVHPNDLTKDEKRRATEGLIFLSEKRDETMKGRIFANGSPQRSHIPKEEA